MIRGKLNLAGQAGEELGAALFSDLNDFADVNFVHGVVNPEREEKSIEQEILDLSTNRILGWVIADLERLPRNLIGKIKHQALLFLRKEGKERHRFA